MRTALIILLSIFSIMDMYSQEKLTDRQPVAAGRFYSAGRETLTKDISTLFSGCKKTSGNLKIRAIICPHAGYVYSGKIAASAISTTSENSDFSNIFIIGSSHIMAFDGASVYHTGDFITPLGRAEVNRQIADKLRKENKVFNFPVNAHNQEHSLEVQIPLIQYYYKTRPKIVPIIIGTDNINTLKSIAEALRPWFTPDNLFIISSDFSHYPSYQDANTIDNLTAGGILSGDPQVFLTTLKKNSSKNIAGLKTSMCGYTSGLVLMYLADKNKDLTFKKIDYCKSGDSPYGDKDGVVGYHAIALVEKNTQKEAGTKTEEDFAFSEEETDKLFNIARNSIKTMLTEHSRLITDEKTIPEALKQPLGAFVTLKINGELRGCIGRFISSDPLYEVVKASAVSSAFEDPRFNPLTLQEYEKADLEITVLGPMKKIKSIDEIILGKHGIYIKKDFRSGTMLPQVATEYGWTVEEFLGYTSRDKAGIGWDGWKDAELFIYEGVVLEENRK